MPIIVNKDITADNADVLSGTDLENVPGMGVMAIYAKSTQADHTITITAPGQETPIRAQLIQKLADAVVSKADDEPIAIETIGGKYNISVDVVAAGTTKLLVIWYTPEEALAEAGIIV